MAALTILSNDSRNDGLSTESASAEQRRRPSFWLPACGFRSLKSKMSSVKIKRSLLPAFLRRVPLPPSTPDRDRHVHGFRPEDEEESLFCESILGLMQKRGKSNHLFCENNDGGCMESGQESDSEQEADKGHSRFQTSKTNSLPTSQSQSAYNS